MLKFIRRYQKWILAVGGTLLMVVFLLPQAAQQMGGDPRNRTYATLGDTRITEGQRALATRQLDSLSRLVPLLIAQLGLDAEQETDHYLLLTESARRMGLIAGPADGQAWLPDLAEQQVQLFYLQQFGPQALQQVMQTTQYAQEVDAARNNILSAVPAAAGASQLTLEEFFQGLANMRGIQRLISTANATPRTPGYRVLLAAKDRADTAYVTAVAIPAGAVDDPFEPSDDDLRATFERFKNQPAGEGEFGIGYTLPKRVKLRWLTLDRARIQDAIQPDPVELRKRWQRDRETYPGEFTDEQERVRADLLADTTDRAIEVADRVVRANILQRTRRLERTGSHYELPADWTPPDLEQISVAVAEALQTELGIAPRRPTVTYRDTDWTRLDEIDDIPGLGQAAFRTGTRPTPIPDALEQLDEFAGSTSLLPVQVGIPVVEPALTDSMGNRYYLLVTDARDVSPPDSIDEIRRQLRFDTRDLRRYEALLNEAESLLATARAEGLAAIEARYESGTTLEQADGRARPRIQINENIQVRPDSALALNSTIYNTPDFRDAVLAHARTIDPTLMGDQIPEDQRFFIVPLPRIPAVAIARMELYAPISAEDFRTVARNLTPEAARLDILARIDAGAPAPLSLEALTERMGFKLRDPARGTEDENPTGSESDAPAPA